MRNPMRMQLSLLRAAMRRAMSPSYPTPWKPPRRSPTSQPSPTQMQPIQDQQTNLKWMRANLLANRPRAPRASNLWTPMREQGAATALQRLTPHQATRLHNQLTAELQEVRIRLDQPATTGQPPVEQALAILRCLQTVQQQLLRQTELRRLKALRTLRYRNPLLTLPKA
jgi:hypothetical protein